MNRFTSIELDYTFDTFKKVIRIDMIKRKSLKIENKNTLRLFRKCIKI